MQTDECVYVVNLSDQLSQLFKANLRIVFQFNQSWKAPYSVTKKIWHNLVIVYYKFRPWLRTVKGCGGMKESVAFVSVLGQTGEKLSAGQGAVRRALGFR